MTSDFRTSLGEHRPLIGLRQLTSVGLGIPGHPDPAYNDDDPSAAWIGDLWNNARFTVVSAGRVARLLTRRRSSYTLVSTLDERQRRLYVGLGSQRLGRGGDCTLAEITGINVDTIAAGRRELATARLSTRVRISGGGRPRAEKKTRRS